MKNWLFPTRFSLLKTFSITYISVALFVRLLLYVIAFSTFDFSLLRLGKILGLGLLFDLGSLSYILAIYSVYLVLLPQKFYGSKLDRILTKTAYSLLLFFLLFSFVAEIPFWLEYQRRFNFIAVDYLLYTYEVIQNIHQSFNLPLLIFLLLFCTYLAVRYAKKRGAYAASFQSDNTFITKALPAFCWIAVACLFHNNIRNTQAEIFETVSENELAKSGLYSFFAAYQSNELPFNEFYATRTKNEVYNTLQNSLITDNETFTKGIESTERFVKNNDTLQKPNVIFIGLESLNARFMKRFGGTTYETPTLDSLAKLSIFFTNIYATGTRTIRGLEAISLSIPPTPGRSIVKRANNNNLQTIGEVFKQQGYSRTFFYGGDGHFDNMTNYFSGNGFDIVDRRKLHRLQTVLPTQRTRISDDEVTFENAWATCDGDLFNKVLRTADKQHEEGRPFFDFVMTSSNHKPYTYPDGIVDIPSGKNRKGAVKYADKMLRDFFAVARTKPWYKNTVFVIMSDHCAYSAGRSELNIKNHHIPAYIFNLNGTVPQEIDKLSSQIDIFPTLFGLLNWSYTSTFFGKDILQMTPKDERAFIGNHRKVGLLKKDKLLVLETQQQHATYRWEKATNELTKTATDSVLLTETIAYYQAAFELFKNGSLSQTKN